MWALACHAIIIDDIHVQSGPSEAPSGALGLSSASLNAVRNPGYTLNDCNVYRRGS